MFIPGIAVAQVASSSLHPVRLQLPWRHQFEFAGFYAAIAQGYYREEGLTVELLEHQPGASVVNEVVSGRVEFGLGNANILVRWYQGAPLILLANLFKHSPLVVLTRQDSDIRQPSDLAGKRLMSHMPDMTSAEIRYMFFKSGISEEEVRMVPHSFKVDELIRGEVDAMTAYITNQPFTLQEAGVDVRIIDPANYGADFYSNNLFTSERMLREHPEKVAAFHRASMKGWRYALAHPDEMIALILREYSQEKTRKALYYEAREVSKLIAQDVYPLGSIDPERLLRLRDVYMRTGVIANPGKDLKQLIWQQAQSVSGLTLTPDERTFLRQYPTIRLCSYPGWLPYEGVRNEQGIGIGPDLAAKVTKRLGLELEHVVFSSWREAVQGLEQQRCDLLSAVVISEERRSLMRFSQHYLDISNAIVTRDDQAYISDLRELTGRTVGVIAGGIHESLLFRLYPELQLKSFLSMEQALSALANGQVAAFVDTVATSGYAIRRSGLHNLHIAGLFPHKTRIAFGVSQGNAELQSLLNKALQHLPAYQLNETVSHWIRVTAEPQVNYRLLWRSVAVIALLTLVFAVFYRRQRRLNHKLSAEIEHRRQAEASVRQLNETLVSRNEQLEVLSRTDVLTGLHNRYHIEKLLEATLLNGYVQQSPVSVLLLDIDHFKQVNDRYGHQAGDQLLQQLAQCLKDFCGDRYQAGRWGGEEFLIILPDTGRDDARVQAEVLRAEVSELKLPYVAQMTVSIGLAERQGDEGLFSLLKRADERLYRAKDHGRNRLIAYD